MLVISILFETGWGNARDTLDIWAKIKEERANRVISAPEEVRTITVDDASAAMNKFLENRRPREAKNTPAEDDEEPVMYQDGFQVKWLPN